MDQHEENIFASVVDLRNGDVIKLSREDDEQWLVLKDDKFFFRDNLSVFVDSESETEPCILFGITKQEDNVYTFCRWSTEEDCMVNDIKVKEQTPLEHDCTIKVQDYYFRFKAIPPKDSSRTSIPMSEEIDIPKIPPPKPKRTFEYHGPEDSLSPTLALETIGEVENGQHELDNQGNDGCHGELHAGKQGDGDCGDNRKYEGDIQYGQVQEEQGFGEENIYEELKSEDNEPLSASQNGWQIVASSEEELDSMLLNDPNLIANQASAYVSRHLLVQSDGRVKSKAIDNLFRGLQEVAELNMDILVDFIKDYKSTVGNHSDDPTAELGPVGRFMVELLKFLLDPVEYSILWLQILSVLLLNCDDFKPFIECKAAATVMGTMSAHMTDEKVQQYGCTVLGHIANYTPLLYEKAPIRESGIELLILALQKHVQKRKVVAPACLALANLTATFSDLTQNMFKEGESTEQAEVTLQHHLDILQYIESQAMPVVEEVITKHPEDHDVQEEGRRFLAFFSPEFRVQQSRYAGSPIEDPEMKREIKQRAYLPVDTATTKSILRMHPSNESLNKKVHFAEDTEGGSKSATDSEDTDDQEESDKRKTSSSLESAAELLLGQFANAPSSKNQLSLSPPTSWTDGPSVEEPMDESLSFSNCHFADVKPPVEMFKSKVADKWMESALHTLETDVMYSDVVTIESELKKENESVLKTECEIKDNPPELCVKMPNDEIPIYATIDETKNSKELNTLSDTQISNATVKSPKQDVHDKILTDSDNRDLDDKKDLPDLKQSEFQEAFKPLNNDAAHTSTMEEVDNLQNETDQNDLYDDVGADSLDIIISSHIKHQTFEAKEKPQSGMMEISTTDRFENNDAPSDSSVSKAEKETHLASPSSGASSKQDIPVTMLHVDSKLNAESHGTREKFPPLTRQSSISEMFNQLAKQTRSLSKWQSLDDVTSPEKKTSMERKERKPRSNSFEEWVPIKAEPVKREPLSIPSVLEASQEHTYDDTTVNTLHTKMALTKENKYDEFGADISKSYKSSEENVYDDVVETERKQETYTKKTDNSLTSASQVSNGGSEVTISPRLQQPQTDRTTFKSPSINLSQNMLSEPNVKPDSLQRQDSFVGVFEIVDDTLSSKLHVDDHDNQTSTGNFPPKHVDIEPVQAMPVSGQIKNDAKDTKTGADIHTPVYSQPVRNDSDMDYQTDNIENASVDDMSGNKQGTKNTHSALMTSEYSQSITKSTPAIVQKPNVKPKRNFVKENAVQTKSTAARRVKMDGKPVLKKDDQSTSAKLNISKGDAQIQHSELSKANQRLGPKGKTTAVVHTGSKASHVPNSSQEKRFGVSPKANPRVGLQKITGSPLSSRESSPARRTDTYGNAVAKAKTDGEGKLKSAKSHPSTPPMPRRNLATTNISPPVSEAKQPVASPRKIKQVHLTNKTPVSQSKTKTDSGMPKSSSALLKGHGTFSSPSKKETDAGSSKPSEKLNVKKGIKKLNPGVAKNERSPAKSTGSMKPATEPSSKSDLSIGNGCTDRDSSSKRSAWGSVQAPDVTSLLANRTMSLAEDGDAIRLATSEASMEGTKRKAWGSIHEPNVEALIANRSDSLMQEDINIITEDVNTNNNNNNMLSVPDGNFEFEDNLYEPVAVNCASVDPEENKSQTRNLINRSIVNSKDCEKLSSGEYDSSMEHKVNATIEEAFSILDTVDISEPSEETEDKTSSHFQMLALRTLVVCYLTSSWKTGRNFPTCLLLDKPIQEVIELMESIDGPVYKLVKGHYTSKTFKGKTFMDLDPIVMKELVRAGRESTSWAQPISCVITMIEELLERNQSERHLDIVCQCLHHLFEKSEIANNDVVQGKSIVSRLQHTLLLLQERVTTDSQVKSMLQLEGCLNQLQKSSAPRS